MTTSSGTEEAAARPRRLPASASGYTLRQQIGQGTTAAVFRALCKPLQDEVAIKVIDLEWINSSLEEIFREIQVMSLSCHKNVVPFSTAFVNGTDLWIVMPLLTGGAVTDLITDVYPTGLPEAHAIYVLRSLLQAIEYFHRNNQIHRDIKAANLLLDSKGNVMLSDYGMMGWMVEGGWQRKQRQTFVGTPCWMAPEVMEQKAGYDYKADIWSLGITAIEIAEGSAPHSNAPAMKILLMTMNNPPPTLKSENGLKYSDTYKDFIASCLKKNPEERPTSAELLKHPLFDGGVEKPEDLENLIAELPPVGSRHGGQKQLYKQLTKVSTVARSGIWERSSLGQGWDFGDDDQANGATDNLGSTGPLDEVDAAGKKSAMAAISDDHPNSDAGSDRRYSFGTYDQDSTNRTDQFNGGFDSSSAKGSEPVFTVNADGQVTSSGVISAANMPAKTIGMLRKGRFTVSDVAVPPKDKVESKLADFLDDDSSAGGISNSSSYNNIATPSNDGSPSGHKNNSSSANSTHSLSASGGGAQTASDANGNIPHSSSAPVVMLTPTTIQGAITAAPVTASALNGVPSNSQTPRNRHSLPLENEISNASANQGPSTTKAPPAPVAKKKSRFEVYDVETSHAKPSASTGAQSTISSSGASTPGQSGSMHTSKTRSKSRFEVADIPISATQNTTTGKDTPAAPPTQQPVSSTVHAPKPTEVHAQAHSVHPPPGLPGLPGPPAPQPASGAPIAPMFSPTHDPTIGSVVANMPAMPPPMYSPFTPVDDYVPGLPAPPLPLPQNLAPSFVPPQHAPPPVGHHHFPSTTTAQQSNVAINALSNVASLHTNILSILQDADRVRKENDYMRRALAASHARQQAYQSQVTSLQQQLANLQQPLREQQQQLERFQQQQQLERFQQQQQLREQQAQLERFQAQQQLVYQEQQQQEMLRQQQMQQQYQYGAQTGTVDAQTNAVAPVARAPVASTYVAVSQTPQNIARLSLPNPPSVSMVSMDMNDATRVQNVAQQQHLYTTTTAKPQASVQGYNSQEDLSNAVKVQNAAQLRPQAAVVPSVTPSIQPMVPSVASSLPSSVMSSIVSTGAPSVPPAGTQLQPQQIPVRTQEVPPRPSSTAPVHSQQLAAAVRQTATATVSVPIAAPRVQPAPQAFPGQGVQPVQQVQQVQPTVRQQQPTVVTTAMPQTAALPVMSQVPAQVVSQVPTAQMAVRRTSAAPTAQQPGVQAQVTQALGSSVQITSIPQPGSAPRRS